MDKKKEVVKSKITRIIAILDPKLKIKFKVKSTMEGKTMTDKIVEMIEDYVKEPLEFEQ